MSSQYIYINSIDECVNNIMDSLYKIFNEDIYKIAYIEKNFKLIESNMIEIINQNVQDKNIQNIITNKNEYNRILELFSDYLFLYFFFYIGTYHDLDTIIKLLNKISIKYPLKFFKNRYISQYSIYYKYIKDYQIVLQNIKELGLDGINKPNLIFMNNYPDVINSISTLDNKIILGIASNPNLLHNIIKIIILREIYYLNDKAIIFKILENDEFSNAEFKYIDIIETKYDIIDYALIESLFDINDIKNGVVEEIYQMITEYETIKYIKDYTIDNKINQLFKNKILIPITDDFLRYHKDSELYEKNIGTKIDPKERTNKKDNTKIRYIVTKVNKVKDYYSPKVAIDYVLKAEIEKNFYQPMMYRKAIIINDTEEINIMRKLELQGSSITETNDYYDDLKQIRLYPYIDFKYTTNDNFSFQTDNTINAIRYCNFEYKNDPKFPNINNTELQYRVINNTSKSNIVGVAIPRFNFISNNNTYLPCHRIKDTMDMSLLYKNSYDVTLKKLRKLFLQDKTYSKLLYWIFNKKNDKIKLELFDNIKELPKSEYIKLLLGKIYDEMVNITYHIILNKINLLDSDDIYMIKTLIKMLETKLVLIPRQSIKYAEIMKLIYFVKIKLITDIKDSNEDKILGTDIPIIKLPKIILDKISIYIINISKTELLSDIVDESDMYEGYLCQHTITWNNIMRLKKKDPNKFNQMLFDFIKKYIVENNDKDFICKSCYQLVDLRNFTTDIYPGSDSINISYNLNTELDTISEYTKYTKAIKNMDKIIEKIAYGSNITYLVGSATENKFRRQDIIKNIIDIINIQYKTLYVKETEKRKERLDKSIKKYGCSMTNFFLFKLDNDIFNYSSKETDKFKLFKMNNILTYALIGILLEINLSQILHLSFDKLVNYFLFEKFGFNLFENLYIRISNKNDIAPIKNYKILCYVIYYLSGIYAKFNLWYTEDIAFKPNNINPQIQRYIIHTFIDAINSILEINCKETKHYIYGMISSKFFNKLNTVFQNNISKDVIERLENINKKKITITIDKKLKYNINIVDAIVLKPYISDGRFITESTLGVKKKVTSYPNIRIINDKLNDKTREVLFGIDRLKDINTKLINDSLIHIATLYNSDGFKRNVQLSIEDAKKLKLEELSKISLMANKIRLDIENKMLKKINKKLEKINIKNITNDKYISDIKQKFNNEITNVIEEFINKLDSLIGKNININNKNYYLLYDAYEIDHDYRGNKRESIFITEIENKIKFKKNDTFFKQDVYTYDDTANQITIYYSSIEKYLIGYKENSKDFIKIYNSNSYLKIYFSIKNQLKLFGFNYTNYKIDNTKINIDDFVNNILRIRLQNLKNSLSSIQQIIYQIKNNYIGSNLNPIAKYYQTKIKSINAYDSDGERIFNNWAILSNNLYYENIEQSSIINKIILPNKNTYISTENLLKFMTNDNILLYYIIQQFNMLLDINNDNYSKVLIAYLIINIIIQLFKNLTSYETAFHDINVKKFYNYILDKAEIAETHDEIDFSTMSEDEIEKYKEETDVDREREDALDANQEETTDDFGDEDLVIRDRGGGEY
jgi:hypothetical protein